MAKTEDYRLGEFTFPRGWFVVAEGRQIERKPFNVHYFGQDMILFRGESGRVVMLDAYCPHMGTHLGKSETAYVVGSGQHIEGDNIRCPFHGWRFGPDGKCNDIPYFDGPIPPGAKIRSWPVIERYGLIFCWHDPEGEEPDFGVPELPEWDDPTWQRWPGLYLIGDMETHPIEVLDNTSDVAHLEYVHGTHIERYENEIDGVYLRQRVNGRAKGNHGIEGNDQFMAQDMSTDVFYCGPGILCSRYKEMLLVQLIMHTPIDDGSVRLWQVSMRKSSSGVPDEQDDAIMQKINEGMVHGLTEDFEIWSNKRPALQIMQIPTDGPFARSRIWYSQFYNTRDRAPDIIAKVQGVHNVRGKQPFSRAEATFW